ncbi:MAG TPA: MFS transporter [Dehalococcoidales bacterium]|nr:MFS transporter [Dehalococcoidales bacterium]
MSSLPFFIIAHAAHHFLMALQQPLFPAMRDYFKIGTYTQASTIPMAFALASATGQLPAGWFADRFGPIGLIMIGTLGVAVAGVLVGISTNFIMLIIFLMLMGFLSGGYHPAATPLISASVEPQQRGRALGFHLVGGNSAFFVAPIIAAAIIGAFGEESGWRYSYLVLAVPTIVFGLIFYFYLSRHGGRAHVETVKRRIIEERPPQPGYKRRLIAFLTMMVVGGGIGMSVLPFLTLYMTDELGASNAVAGGLMSIVFSSGLWAGPLGGYISDKIGSIKVIIATGILSGILLYAFKLVELGPSLYIVLFIHGLIMALRMPVTEVFIMSQAPAKHRSKIFGVYYSTMQYTGAIFVLPGGYLLERFGFDTMFTWAAVGVTVVAIVTAFFIFDAKDNYQGETQVS